MPYPEPSINDHNAPWNEIEIEDENGDTITVCGCAACRKKRHDESIYWGDVYDRRRDNW